LKLTLPALGGVGLFLSALIDSSFLPLPLVTDFLLMELSSRHPVRMPYYAAMASIGSLAGCIWIYWLARKSGQTYYRKATNIRRAGFERSFKSTRWHLSFFPLLHRFRCRLNRL